MNPARGVAVAAAFLCGALLAAVPAQAQMAPPPAPEKARERERAPVLLLPMVDYIEDSDGDTFWDPSVFAAWKNLAAQVWYGEFTKGLQFGGFLRDKRRSTYGGWYRFRHDFDHTVELNTEQVVGRGFVVAGALRFIRVIPEDVVEDRSLLEPRVGFDKYYRSYSFFSFRAIRDPRFDGEYVFVISNRFALKDKWLTAGIVPRTDGELGWFVMGKWRWVRVGYGNYNRFDFTGIDRKIFTVGVELQLGTGKLFP
jgi:hypothetical protein